MYSLWGFPSKQRACDFFFSGGNPRRFGVTSRILLQSVLFFILARAILLTSLISLFQQVFQPSSTTKMYRLRKGYILFICGIVLVTYLLFHLDTRVSFPRDSDSAGPGILVVNSNVTHKSRNDSIPWVIVFWSTVFGA